MKPRLLLAVVLLAPLAGCSSPKPVYFSRPERTVAVLPPFHVKPQVWKAVWPLVEGQLSRRGFTLVPRATVEAFYADNKFTLPAEVTQYSSAELCKALGAELILYTTVLEWKEITLLVYNKFRVKVRVALKTPKDVVLYDRTGWATRKKHLSVHAMFEHATRLAAKAVRNCFSRLPPVPPPGYQPPPE